MYIKARNEELDISKGIAILLVIWGHTIQYCYAGEEGFYENIIFRLIYGFHMPYFMIISGYLFFYSCEKYDLKKILKRQFNNIVYPLFIWNGISFGCRLLYERKKIHSFEEYVRLLYVSLRGLWFLWSIFFISVLIAVVYFYCKNKRKLWGGYIVVYTILMVIPEIIEPSKTMNLWLYPYFLTGFILAEIGDKALIVRIRECNIKCGFIIIYPILIHYFHFRDYVYVSKINPFCSEYGFINQVQINIFRWFLGYAGIGFMTTIIHRLCTRTNVKRFLYLLFGKLGQITLKIYVLQSILLEEVFAGAYKILVTKMGGNPLVYNMGLFNLVWTPVIGLVNLFIILKIIMLIERHNKWNKIFF